jgi:hypothetical protein
MRDGLERPGLVLAPDRQAGLRVEPVGPLDQVFFAAASTSVTATAPPSRRLRETVPVARQGSGRELDAHTSFQLVRGDSV